MGDRTEERFAGLLAEAVRSPAVLAPGTRLTNDRYVVRRVLGSGGMGVVYLATDRNRGTNIVLKSLPWASGATVYQLKREFRSVADLSHPNLVGLYDLVCDDDVWFITMDHVAGLDLRRYVQQNGEWAALRPVFAQLARGIGALHDAGLLHRDLKPSNVLVTAEGKVVILDFGLACQELDRGADVTSQESCSGTPLYMSPEQAAGEPITRSSDWYAFGVMLYDVLCGELPFDGSRREVLQAKVKQRAPEPVANLPGVNPAETQLCAALLRRNPRRRAGLYDVERVLPLSATPSESCGDPLEKAPFVGRSAECAALEQALEATDCDKPVVVLLQGESGVGKTALVTRFLDGLKKQERAVVLRGRCYENESVPYRGADSLVDSLSRYLRQRSAADIAQLLPRRVHALARVFPVFGRAELVGRVRQRLPLPQDPSELLGTGQTALKELLARLAAQELLVLHLDDAQWCDVDGARLLVRLLALPEAPAMLLLCSFRGDEVTANPGLEALLDGLERLEGLDVRTLALAGLSDAESRGLVEQLMPDAQHEWVANIVAGSQGNPFIITAVTGWSATEAPGSASNRSTLDVESALLQRAGELERADRELLEAVCVARHAVTYDLLQHVCGQPDITPRVRRLQARRWLRSSRARADTLVVYHDRIGSAIRSGLDEVRLAQWHSAFVRALEHTTGDVDPERLTHHLLGAGELSRAGETALSAAATANAALAFDRAVDLFDIALTHGTWDADTQVALRVSRGEALVNGLRAAEAGAAFLQAAELTMQPSLREELWSRGGEQLLLSGHTRAGFDALRRVFAARGLDFDALQRVDFKVLLLELFARGLSFDPTPMDALDPEARLRLEAIWSAALGLVNLRYAESFALALRCLLDALELGAVPFVARGLMGAAILEAALMPAQQEMLQLMRRLSQELEGDPLAPVYLTLTEGHIAIMYSQPTRLLDSAERALVLLERGTVGRVKERSIARTLLLSAHFQRGDLATLRRVALPWLEEARRQQNNDLSSWIHIYLVIHYLATGQPDLARAALASAARFGQDEPPEIVATAIGQYAALCDAYEGEPGGWDRIGEVGERIAASELAAHPLKVSDQAYFSALVAIRLAPGHAKQERLLEAADQNTCVLESLELPDGRSLPLDYWVPHAHLLRAGLCAFRGDPEGALPLLDAALESFDAVDSSLSSRACALRRKGELMVYLGNRKSGSAVRKQADAELERLGITEPRRFCDLFAPGFHGVSSPTR